MVNAALFNPTPSGGRWKDAAQLRNYTAGAPLTIQKVTGLALSEMRPNWVMIQRVVVT